jgi:hypothetical protein
MGIIHKQTPYGRLAAAQKIREHTAERMNITVAEQLLVRSTQEMAGTLQGGRRFRWWRVSRRYQRVRGVSPCSGTFSGSTRIATDRSGVRWALSPARA